MTKYLFTILLALNFSAPAFAAQYANPQDNEGGGFLECDSRGLPGQHLYVVEITGSEVLGGFNQAYISIDGKAQPPIMVRPTAQGHGYYAPMKNLTITINGACDKMGEEISGSMVYDNQSIPTISCRRLIQNH